MNILFFLIPKEEVSYIYEDNSVRQGIEKMRAHGYTAIPVLTRDGKYVGTISEGDFLWHLVDLNSTQMRIQENCFVKDLPKKDRITPVTINTSMEDLLMRVMDQNFVPVVDDRHLFVGIVTRKDIIKFFYDREKKRLTENKGADIHDED
ncbi:MAG: CBS domain-containing protein [Lachnospiraceae bacterium]